MSVAVRVSALNSVSFGWLHQEGGFTFDEPFFLDPQVRFDRERRMQAFVAERFPDEPIYSLEAHLVQIEGRSRPVALVGGIQPNLILAAAVGAKFVFQADKDPDVDGPPLAECDDIAPLRDIDWADTWPVSLFLEQIAQMRGLVGPEVSVIPPFFWDATGRATTHGILTTAQKLFGERIFIELLENPGFVREAMAWIVDSYIALIRLFATAADLRVSGLHTGDCSLCMIGPDLFSEHILPELNRFTRAVGPVRLHSCGKSDHLLRAFTEVENVVALNFGSGTSLARIRDCFGPMRVDLAPDPKLLTTGSTRDLDAWVRRIVEENGDGRLEIQCHLDAGQPAVNCLQVTRTLRDLGIACRRIPVY